MKGTALRKKPHTTGVLENNNPKSIEKFLEEYLQGITSFDKLLNEKCNLIKIC